MKFKFFDDVVNQDDYILIFFYYNLICYWMCVMHNIFSYATQKTLSLEESIQPAS